MEESAVIPIEQQK